MKSYMAEGQMQLSGKAWQIRHLLKEWRKQAEPQMSLEAFIQKQMKQTRNAR